MAGQGLRIWDEGGNLILDTNDRIGRIIGIYTITGGVDGSITNSEFATGTPFWQLIPVVSYVSLYPEITSSGSTISWAFDPDRSWTGFDNKLIYGVY